MQRLEAGQSEVVMKADRVLFPVDFSEPSRACLREGIALLGAEPPREIHLLYVLRTPADFSAWQGDPRAEALELLAGIARPLREEGRSVRTAVVIGHPATEICRYGAGEGIDLIVLATHGRTGLKHILLGSTAEQVVRHAPCPVLILRAQPGAEPAPGTDEK
jgi:universal stress protein A